MAISLQIYSNEQMASILLGESGGLFNHVGFYSIMQLYHQFQLYHMPKWFPYN